MLTRAVDGPGEDVTRACRVLAADVPANAQGHGGAGVAEASSDCADRDTAQACGPGVSGPELTGGLVRLVLAKDGRLKP